MSDVELLVFAAVSIVTSTFSAIAGGGGGFINTPLLVFIGLSPAQAVASGKLMGLSEIAASIAILRKQKLHSWAKIMPLIGLSILAAFISQKLIREIEGDVFKRVIGVLVLLMIPAVHFKKSGHVHKDVTGIKEKIGHGLSFIAFLIQGTFSSGTGMLVNLILVSFMGMSALEANVTKRYTQIFLNGIIALSLLTSGLMVWRIIAVGVVTNFIGGMIGGHLAVSKGNEFVMSILKIAMLASGISMLVV